MGNTECLSCNLKHAEDEIQFPHLRDTNINKDKNNRETLRENYKGVALTESEHFEFTKIPHVEEKLEAIDTVKEINQITIEFGDDVNNNINNKGL
jgi:hypothetical protein